MNRCKTIYFNFITEFKMVLNLLTPQQVSNILGISVGTLAVWRTTKRYNLPYVKAGRLIRYRMEDVQAFIESRTQTQENQYPFSKGA